MLKKKAAHTCEIKHCHRCAREIIFILFQFYFSCILLCVLCEPLKPHAINGQHVEL